MTDLGLVAKKLARVESCIHDLADVDPASLGADLVVERFVERTLQIAIQAVIDIASHIVADHRLGDPASNHDLFGILARHGWVPAPRLSVLHRIVGFRNVLVHDYDEVDLEIVRIVLRQHLPDLQAFVDAVRGRVNGPG